MKWIYKYPKTIVVIIIAVTVILASQIPKIIINNEVNIFLPEDDPSKTAYNRTEEEFGSQEMIDIAVESKTGTILTADNIKIIDKLTKKLENMDFVEDVISLTNADFIEGTADGMSSAAIAEDFTGTEEELKDIRKKLSDWYDMYKLNLVSENFSATQIIIKIAVDTIAKEKEVLYNNIKALLSENKNDSLNYYLAGDPSIVVLIKKYIIRDLAMLIPIVAIVVLLFLYLSFKTAEGVILPFLTVIISTVWTVGLMAVTGVCFSIVSSTLPVLLIAIGSAYGIHLVNAYYMEISERGNKSENSPESRRETVFAVFGRVGKAIFLAGITTIAGLASLGTSRIIPLKQYALFSALGVFTALAVSLTLIPSLWIIKRGNTAVKIQSKKKEPFLDRFFDSLSEKLEGKKKIIFAVVIAVTIISCIGISMIVIDNNLIMNFGEKEEIRIADKMIQKNFGGTKVFSITVRGEEKGCMTDPEILTAMDDLKNYLENNFEEVGKVISFSDFIKRMNKVMNYPSGSSCDDSAAGEKNGDTEESSFSDYSSFFAQNEISSSEETVSFFENSSLEEALPEDSKEEFPDLTKNISLEGFCGLLTDAISETNSSNPSAKEVIKKFFAKINYKGEAYNEIPSDISKYPVGSKEELKNLISQYLLLYSGNLDSYSNDSLEPTAALMMVQLKCENTEPVDRITKVAMKYVSENFPEGYDAEIAGYADQENAMTTLITHSQISSLALSAILVFIIVAIAFKSGTAGILGVIPLSIAILANFGIMGFFKIRLDMATALIASIAVGIGIDYTIHFLSAYKKYRLGSDDLYTVTKKTMHSCGRAITFNAISVAAGFLVFCLSNFTTLRYIGILVFITMFTSSAAALTLLPVLLNIFKPKFLLKK